MDIHEKLVEILCDVIELDYNEIKQNSDENEILDYELDSLTMIQFLVAIE